jgi:phage shock protein E
MFGLFGKKCMTLSMKEAQVELEKDKNILLLDVRSVDEYQKGHIKGSKNRDRIFVYCLSGSRSNQACSWMTQNGYENVTNIGGISSWSGPVERG